MIHGLGGARGASWTADRAQQFAVSRGRHDASLVHEGSERACHCGGSEELPEVGNAAIFIFSTSNVVFNTFNALRRSCCDTPKCICSSYFLNDANFCSPGQENCAVAHDAPHASNFDAIGGKMPEVLPASEISRSHSASHLEPCHRWQPFHTRGDTLVTPQ